MGPRIISIFLIINSLAATRTGVTKKYLHIIAVINYYGYD